MLEIEYVPTEDLIPYINNSRTHSESQVKQIAASIREFGFTNPILIDEEQTIIAGHGRVMAAEVLSMPTVPCIRLSGLSEAQRKAYVIADNKLIINSEWNIDILQTELEQLMSTDFNLELIGFTAVELNDLLMGHDTSDSPDDFKDINDTSLAHECPKCGYEFD